MAWIAGGPDDLAVIVTFGANFGPLVAAGEIWRLVVSMFLHANLLHLLVNGYALFLLGSNLEAFYGPWRFLFLYLVSGLAGSIASASLARVISVGASGGIFGLLGGSLVFAFKYRRILPPRVTRVMGTALLPWVALNIVLGILVPRIDMNAHLGGLAGGAVVALLLTPRSLLGALGSGQSATPRYLPSVCLSLLLVSFAGAGHNIFRMRGEDGPILDPRAMAVIAEIEQEETMRLVEKELARNPDATIWLHARAQIRTSRGLWKGAVEDYRRILEIDPEDFQAMNNLAWLLLEEVPQALRDPTEAELLAREAVRLAPEDPHVLGTYGTARLRAGNPEEAVAYLAAALEKRRGIREEPTDRYLLAIALARTGRVREAGESLRRAVREDPENAYRTEAERAVAGETIQSAPAP